MDTYIDGKTDPMSDLRILSDDEIDAVNGGFLGALLGLIAGAVGLAGFIGFAYAGFVAMLRAWDR